MTLRRVRISSFHPRYHSNCSIFTAPLGIYQFLCLHAAMTGGFYLPFLTKLSFPRLRSYKHKEFYNNSHPPLSLWNKTDLYALFVDAFIKYVGILSQLFRFVNIFLIFQRNPHQIDRFDRDQSLFLRTFKADSPP